MNKKQKIIINFVTGNIGKVKTMQNAFVRVKGRRPKTLSSHQETPEESSFIKLVKKIFSD